MRLKIIEKLGQTNITEIDKYNEERELMHRLEEHARIEGLRQEYLEAKLTEDIKVVLDNKADDDQVLKRDGSANLTSDWDVGDEKCIKTDEIRARDSDGLGLYNDSGFGIFIKEDNRIGIGTQTPLAKLSIDGDLHVNQGVTVFGILDWSSSPSKPKIYVQSLEPELENDSYAFWKDVSTGRYYILANIGGIQKKVEMV